MNIRKRILIPMITLTIVSGIAVLISSILLFNREIEHAMYEKVNVASMVAEHELIRLKETALIVALGMADNPDLATAIENNDRDSILYIANNFRTITQLDYSVIYDAEGTSIVRTHEPDNYGDNLRHMPHIRSALDGEIEAYIFQGATVLLGASAGAPIYDEAGNIIGAITLGFMLDKQDLVDRLKYLTDCEIAIFRDDERIATTFLNEDDSYAFGTEVEDNISEIVLAGGVYTGRMQVFDKDAIKKYVPVHGADDEVVGMIGIVYYTADETGRLAFFIILGVVIALAVLAVCIVIARLISGVIQSNLDRTMKELRETDEYLQLMFDSTPMSCTLWSKDFKIINCNHEALKLYDIKSKDEFIKRFYELSPKIQPNGEPSKEHAITLLEKAFAEGYMHSEWMHRSLNGEPLPSEVTLVRIKFKDDFLVAGYTRDLREHTRMMAAIQERETELTKINETNEVQLIMLESVIKASKFALWTLEVVKGDPVNPNNKIIWTNEFRNMLGYTDENEFPNILNSWSDLLHPDDKDRVQKALASHILDMTGQTPFDVEYQMMKKNGEYSYFRATGETIRDEECKAVRVAGALMDISEAKNLMAEMKKKQAEAEAANQTKSVFLANMSHEIRTPMNSIIGFSELAQYGDIPEKTREYIINIQDSATWLLKIINDILDISKIESGKIVLESIPFDLPDIFEHCQSTITPKAKDKGIMLYCYAEPSVGKKLLGDSVRLRQVLINLLSNAVKFTNVGTIKLLASVVHKTDDRITINFEVKDSGIGMNDEQIEKIFEPFTQADASVTRRFGGTGLGLTITKDIIELMGGTLCVESAVGVGSRFSFSLTFDMIDDVSSDSTLQRIIVNEFEKPNFKGEVLVCEDNSLNQQVICEHLARVGLKTVVAHNGKEGVDIVTARIKNGDKTFDLIFMDIHMPVMDGLDAAAKIFEMGVNTPIVALTANVMSNDLELYKISGMSDTVGKPFTTQELWRCLVKYIPVESYSVVDKIRQSAEEEKMQKQLCINFVKNNQNTQSEFIKALNEGDNVLAHRIVHTLKSNAGQIGEKRLQTAAAVAENVLAEGISLLTKEQTRSLELELNIVLEKLMPLLTEAMSSGESEPIDTGKALEILDKLEPLLDNSDTDCLNLVGDLHGIPGADELIHQIEGYKFKPALITLNNLRRELKKKHE